MEPIENHTATKEQDYYSILLTAEDQLQTGMEADPMDQGEVAPPDGPPLLQEEEPGLPVNQAQGEAVQGENIGPFCGFEPDPNAVQPRRSKRIEQYRESRGYQRKFPAIADDATCLPAKIYGKQDITYQQALSSPDAHQWEAAIKDEYSSLIRNGTWELVPLPPDRTAIKCKWVFDIKPGYEGVDERYKAHPIALGCSQLPGLDYDQIYFPQWLSCRHSDCTWLWLPQETWKYCK